MGHDIDLKVVLLGKEFGGKTSLVERYLYNRYNGEVPYQNTIGAAYGAKAVHIKDRVIKMGIWDTAGSERYHAMSKIYYRGARAAIICYDLTDETSFERAKFWVKELKNYEENCKIYLCGTKHDCLEMDENSRKVDYFTSTSYGESIGALIIETSSKTGENVAKLFEMIATDYINTPSMQREKTTGTLSIDAGPKERKLLCCRY